MSALSVFRRLAVIAFFALVAAAPVGQDARGDEPTGHAIGGRVVDPHQLRPEGAVLMSAENDPNGTFVLRNAFGPRVLRTGYVPVPGSMWWPSKVILDGT